MEFAAQAPEDDEIVRATRNWVERAVIGLALCPFANSVHTKGLIRYSVSHAQSPEALLADLRSELQALSQVSPDVVETTLLVAPRVLSDFLEYNDFLELADGAIEELGLGGIVQIASFHPDYQFGDIAADDPANCSNRSPYPTLHLLREASVTRSVQVFPEASQIFEKNIATLRALGHAGFGRVLSGEEATAGAFASLGLSPALLTAVAELGFEKLTEIQARSIPALLAGRDLVGQSKTGSGKTAAFALPLLERLSLSTREIQAVVLCPTRELSAQVAREFRKLGRARPGLAVVVLSGGEPVRDQTRVLEKGVHLVVGTPGRVLDHLRRRTLRVHRVGTVVLDEADRMLEMGFQADLEKLLKALPKPRQTVFFSATFPTSIRELIAKYQLNPTWVGLEQAHDKPDIVELLVRCATSEKLGTLEWALGHHAHEAALVFANQKLTVAEIEKSLLARGVSVAALHGDLDQRDRDRVMAKFRNGSTRVLVATDVAARGIDLESLDLVVNYDLPNQPELYVHRIGRTGRAGKSGLALSFAAPADEAKLDAITQYTGVALAPVRRDSAKSAPPATDSVRREAKMDTLRLSGGRKDKLRPGDILGALTGEAGLDGDSIGKIEIHERFSFVAVDKAVSQKALENLNRGRIKGRRFRVERAE